MNDLERRQLRDRPPLVALRPGQEYWEDTPHLLAARIKRERDRGRVHEVMRWEVSRGRHAAIVMRLRPRPSRRRIMALWASGVGVAMAAVGVATWWVAVHLIEVLSSILMILLVAGGLAILTRVLSGHRATCAGLHCPGCRH
jgi:hypothetical protein